MNRAARITIAYEPGDDGWVTATILEVVGVYGRGRTTAEARANALDVLRWRLSPGPAEREDSSLHRAPMRTISRARRWSLSG